MKIESYKEAKVFSLNTTTIDRTTTGTTHVFNHSLNLIIYMINGSVFSLYLCIYPPFELNAFYTNDPRIHSPGHTTQQGVLIRKT